MVHFDGPSSMYLELSTYLRQLLTLLIKTYTFCTFCIHFRRADVPFLVMEI